MSRMFRPKFTSKIELKQLKYVVMAAEQGSFRKAALALDIKQSTLSRSIRQLEDATSTEIFIRRSGGVTASEPGRGVIHTAKTVLEQIEFLSSRNQVGANGRRGALSVGFCTSLSLGGLRTALLEFRARYPQFQLVAYERSRKRLSSALHSGQLDVVIVPGKIRGVEYQSLMLWSERVLIAVPEDHPLATRETVYWTDLRQEILLMTRHDPYWEFEELITSKLLSSEDRPPIERHDVSRSILKSLISMKLGLGLMLESDAGARVPSIVFKELRDGTGPTRVGFSAFWRKANDNPALAGFIELMNDRYQTST
jgi:DNA-binding transcriptional LysR family regulator